MSGEEGIPDSRFQMPDSRFQIQGFPECRMQNQESRSGLQIRLRIPALILEVIECSLWNLES
jgi:hypothetical protein